MNRKNAKIIVETITNQQLQNMFNRAKDGITDWTKVSICNKGLTKGVAWNILAKDFDINIQHSKLGKINMIREFGDFLPEEIKIKKLQKKEQKPPTHQDPIFN